MKVPGYLILTDGEKEGTEGLKEIPRYKMSKWKPKKF